VLGIHSPGEKRHFRVTDDQIEQALALQVVDGRLVSPASR
jgi:hypothetical protein